MTIRQRITDIIGGRTLQTERVQMREAFDQLYKAYLDGKFITTPQMLAERLAEYDSATVMQLLRQRQGLYPYSMDVDSAREYQVQESRRQWLYSPLAQWSVNVWTSYGLGERVKVTANDEPANEIWEQTWNNSSIFDDDNIHALSDNVLVDGDIFLLAFVSISDGAVTFEYLDGDEVTEIIAYPENKNRALYYKRLYQDRDMSTRTIYYPDWCAYLYDPESLQQPGLIPSDAEVSVSEQMTDRNGTTILVMHIAHNRKSNKSLRGWPILGIAAPYLQAHKEFMETRLTVAKQKAMFVREMTVEGGSRAVKGVQARFDSQLGTSNASYYDPNPSAVPGSTLVHNRAAEHTDLPMTTGAGDATSDNNMFSWMGLIGAGLFPTTAGLDTSRWATAVAMDKTQSAQWTRYQSFWSAQFRRMVELVLLCAEKWGGKKFDDKTCTVSIDTLSLVDFPGVVPPITQVLNACAQFQADGTLNQNAMREILQAMLYPIMQALGVEEVDDILSDESMGVITADETEQAAEYKRGIVELARRIYEAKKVGHHEKQH